jgi:lysyl-tRNA synthetase class I
VPGVDLVARVEAEKGSPLTVREREILDERIGAAKGWLEVYAPDRARIAVRRDALPAEAAALAPDQREFLAELASAAGRDEPADGDAWQ